MKHIEDEYEFIDSLVGIGELTLERLEKAVDERDAKFFELLAEQYSIMKMKRAAKDYIGDQYA